MKLPRFMDFEKMQKKDKQVWSVFFPVRLEPSSLFLSVCQIILNAFVCLIHHISASATKNEKKKFIFSKFYQGTEESKGEKKFKSYFCIIKVCAFRCDNLCLGNIKTLNVSACVLWAPVHTHIDMRVMGEPRMLFAWIFSESIILNLLFACIKRTKCKKE